MEIEGFNISILTEWKPAEIPFPTTPEGGLAFLVAEVWLHGISLPFPPSLELRAVILFDGDPSKLSKVKLLLDADGDGSSDLEASSASVFSNIHFLGRGKVGGYGLLMVVARFDRVELRVGDGVSVTFSIYFRDGSRLKGRVEVRVLRKPYPY